jgi:hypothetical protein
MEQRENIELRGERQFLAKKTCYLTKIMYRKFTFLEKIKKGERNLALIIL